MVSMRMGLKLATTVVCAVLAFGPHVSAHEQKNDGSFLLESNELTKESCPRIVAFLNTPEAGRQGFEKTFIATRAAYWSLYLDCPTDHPGQPVDVLHAWWHPVLGGGIALILGSVYEYGIRVDPDLDEARYWYRQAVYMYFDISEEQQDNFRLKIAGLNPILKHMTDAEIEAAWEAGELKSPIFEEEITAVQSLMDGPVADIIAASEHLYRGTNGYPRSKKVAQRILEVVSRKGVPEAQYALALGILDRRFSQLKKSRAVQFLEAQQYLREAAGANFLPAIKTYADLCEKIQAIHAQAIAYALYEVLQRKGTQVTDADLRRFKKDRGPIFDQDLHRARESISRGTILTCY